MEFVMNILGKLVIIPKENYTYRNVKLNKKNYKFITELLVLIYFYIFNNLIYRTSMLSREKEKRKC